MDIIEEGQFKFIESNTEGDTLLLLHGLFGGLSNFEGLMNAFSKDYNVVVPILPIFEMPIREVSVTGLVEHVAAFVEHKGYDKVNLVGNSLGGHVGLLYTLGYADKVASICLTGSSGLFESSFGSTFPKRGNYEFVKTKTEGTFYDPKIATKELIDEVFETVNDRTRAIRVVVMAKSAVRHNLGDKLHQIKAPALLIWGKDDTITPPFVGEKFNELIENSTLHFLDKCGHAPMMEKPAEFNQLLHDFLKEL